MGSELNNNNYYYNHKGPFIIYDWGWAGLVQKGGGVQLLIIVEKNLTCNDYCYQREVAIIVVLPVRGRFCWFAVSSPSQIRA
jgi:hypothetical protein